MQSPFVGRPRIFRDPIHGDIEWPQTSFGKLVRDLIDTPAFQRLRHIRQNGVLNLVFHGAEHSRFAHSVGVAWVASKMLDAVERNSRESIDPLVREDTILAALLHDVGHGPFSHTIEEVLNHGSSAKDKFSHEDMTIRFLTDSGSEIASLLEESSPGRSQRLVQFIDKKRRSPQHWWHTIVSSQLDADRLDYIRRDARMAGIDNHRPDIARLVGHLSCRGDAVVVDHRAFDVIESMLLALDHLYGSVYFHRTVRAATTLLSATFSRATQIAADDVLPADDPLRALLRERKNISLEDYGRGSDATVWYHLDRWTHAKDPELKFFAERLRRRQLPKHIGLPEGYGELQRLLTQAKALARERFPECSEERLVVVDDPSRLNYKRYRASGADPILTWDRNGGEARPVEEIDTEHSIIPKVANKLYRSRIYVPAEIHEELCAFARAEKLL